MCVGLNEYIDRITQISSITEPIFGTSSLTSTPLRPYFWNLKLDGSSPPVCRSVRRSTSLGLCPAYLRSPGLGSNMSRCEGPPGMNRLITRLAFTGSFGPAYRVSAAASASGVESSADNPTLPKSAAQRLNHRSPGERPCRRRSCHGQKISSLVDSRTCAYWSSVPSVRCQDSLLPGPFPSHSVPEPVPGDTTL